ncbi:Hsp20/alpha crystallin family protein [Pontibacillus salipaludis]|uniref:Hsp20/alpha crystallin family protein n=1 Tax=Pontibacillus salipaludis TaxID=1697394 RepID=UPI0031E89808
MKQLNDLFSQIQSMQKSMGNFHNSSNPAFDLSSIDTYIKDTIQQALGPQLGGEDQTIPIENGSSKSHLSYEMVELHHYYIVKIKIPDFIEVENIRLSLGNCRLYVHGLPGGESQTIALPEQPHTKQAHAQYKGGLLEVRLARYTKEDTKDIYIQY